MIMKMNTIILQIYFTLLLTIAHLPIIEKNVNKLLINNYSRYTDIYIFIEIK